MIDVQMISVIVGMFLGLGAMIAGCGYAYAQYKSGGEKYKDSLIETLKETADAERQERERLAKEKTELLLNHQQQITQLTKDQSELKGRLDEQSKKADEYKALLLGRDPELQKILSEIRSYLRTLTEQSNINQNRNEGIDEATKQEKGKVLRKKV